MITVLIINTLIVFFAWLESVKVIKYGLFISFAFLFLFLALRYDFGNDYKEYYQMFKEINRYKTINFFNREFNFEGGWVMLCRAFRPFGFFSMVAFLALFNCWIYYRFIRKYVPEEYYWFAVFIYVFSPQIMLVHSSAMRQSVAIGLFIWAIDFIIKKKIIPYLLLVSLASLFHSSALILLPVYILAYTNFPLKKFGQLAFAALFVLLFFTQQSLGSLLNTIIASNFDRYEIYDEVTQVGTGLGILILSFFFVVILFFENLQDFKNRILFKLSVLSYLFIPLGLILVMIGRIGMYFDVAKIAVFPLLFISIKKPFLKYLYSGAIITFTLFSFYSFFESEVYGNAFSVYKTILPSLFLRLK